MPKKLTLEQFIEKASIIHKRLYDYSKSKYINSYTKVCIICPTHGEFWQNPNNHVAGKGCPTCGAIKNGEGRRDFCKKLRPDLSHIKTPTGSKAVPVGTKGDYALVDDEDYDRVMQYNWYLDTGGYARNDTVGAMHRMVTNAPDGTDVDHIFHNKLDNRKSQLRVCTHQENGFNRKRRAFGTSKYNGVFWDKSRNRWHVRIMVDYKKIYIGRFEDEEEAARAYDEEAKKHHREFATLNFPEEVH